MSRSLLGLALALSAPLSAQTITLAEGTPSSSTILSVPESSPNAAATVVLSDVELLPIEITGRYLGQESDASCSRRLERNGVVRVELPGGARLFRYRRSGGSAWGFLHVDDEGTPRVVLEQPGVGSSDPFEDRIGVSRAGDHFCVPLVSGGLFVVRLDGNVYPSTGLASRFIAAGIIVEPPSVMVGGGFVWYQSEQLEVFRCGLGDGAVADDVSPPFQANAILKDQMAMAGDGSRIVFLYGPQQQQRLYTVGSSGGATVLPPLASKYEDPGYLPEDEGSPALMLNESGSQLFYVDSDIRDELYLLDISGALPTLHITGDAIFEPYIGVHILPGFYAGKLTVAIGGPNQMDWFRAELTAAGGTVDNLTSTGSATQPFPEGSIDPRTAVRADDQVLAVEQNLNAFVIRRIDLASGAQVVVHDDAIAPPVAGGSLGGEADFVIKTVSGDRLYSAAGGLPLFELPDFLSFGTPARGQAYSTVWYQLASGWGASAFYLSNGQYVLGPVEFGMEQLCVTKQGGTVAIGNPVRYVAPGVFIIMNRPTVSWRRCLSGAGA